MIGSDPAVRLGEPMRLFAPTDTRPEETRACLVPAAVERLIKLGLIVEVQSGLGATLGISDESYRAAGAAIVADRMAGFRAADMALGLNAPRLEDVGLLRKGAILVGFLDPFNASELIRALAERGISALSMEMIPRTTLAQKMDALSSQASIAGYVAVTLAAERLGRIFPMMMTPAGTIAAARVFIIGVGVAGLQAIATARRLGARVEAFDTRPVVEEQVKSLGARFFKVDLGETGEAAGGYAKALTPEQLEKQRVAMAKRCAESDVVITAAQVFGRKAPVILTADMVRGMKPGSVVVDCAVETGGNVECVVRDQESDVGGVRVVGYANLPGRAAVTASEMYASNLTNFVGHFFDKASSRFRLDRENEIIKGALVTYGGEVVNETIRNALGKG